VFRPLVEPRARWLFRPEPSTATGTIVLPPEALPPLPGPAPEAAPVQRVDAPDARDDGAGVPDATEPDPPPRTGPDAPA
jgi:hypothetical protein